MTTVSGSSQSVYVFPANFASISNDFRVAFGVIPQDDMVRDVVVVSELLQPLPGKCTDKYFYRSDVHSK